MTSSIIHRMAGGMLLLALLASCAAPPGPVSWKHGVVVTADSAASAVALSVLRRGGNAVDAAVAAGFALAVTFPEAGNLGGGGFLLVRFPDGASHAIDFRETAPGRATAGMYRGREAESVSGCLAAAVPGSVAGLLSALDRFGTMERAELIAPAIALAERGFPVDANLASNLEDYAAELRRSDAVRGIFFRGDRPLREGERLVQSDLGRTLRRIAAAGTDGFYAGETAGMIAGHMSRCGGIIDRADLEAYRPVSRPVLEGRYRGYDLLTVGPPTSGGLCLLQALALLEPFDLGNDGPGSARSIHLTVEAMKRAFSMRAAYLGDPDFVGVPVEGILRAGRTLPGRFSIDTARAVPADSIAAFPGYAREGSETTHFSVVDRDGMAVAVTTTINDLFGNKEIVEGAGFFLNDEMDDFVTAPGEPNLYGLIGGEENMIAPGKRPLSSMSPTIVARDGAPVLVLGARGGSKIISAVLQVILNVIDHGMTPEDAVRSPRVHHQWLPDTVIAERGAVSPEAAAELVRMGHRLRARPGVVGAIEAVFVEPRTGLRRGVPDHREGGRAAGY